jgi:hypothetical protein
MVYLEMILLERSSQQLAHVSSEDGSRDYDEAYACISLADLQIHLAFY